MGRRTTRVKLRNNVSYFAIDIGPNGESRGKNGGIRVPLTRPKGFFCRTTKENMKILARSIELFPNDYIYKNTNMSTSVHVNLAIDLFHNGGPYILLNG